MKKTRTFLGFLYRHKFIRYLFVGVTTVIVDISTLAFMREVLNINLTVAASVSYWLSIAYNFTINRWWTFSAQEVKSLAEHAFLYATLLIINYIYTIVALSVLSQHIHYTIAKLFVIAFATLWTYPLYKHVIFKKPS